MPYEDMDKLKPCPECGSHSYWFDGEEWQCERCHPADTKNPMRYVIEKKRQKLQ